MNWREIAIPILKFEKMHGEEKPVWGVTIVMVEEGSRFHQAYEALFGSRRHQPRPAVCEEHVPLIHRCPVLRAK